MIRMESMGPDGKDAEESLVVEAAVDDAAAEVETASGDVTEVDTGIDDAVEAKGELDEVTELVQEAVDDGDGLSPREAAHVEARLERVMSLLGTTAKKQGLAFRRESFGGTHSRLAATKMRLEDLKEFGQGIWEAIKRGWEWLKDAVKTIYAGLTKNSKMIIQRFEDLQGRLDKLNGDVQTKDSKQKTGAAYFSIENKTDLETIKKILDIAGKIPLMVAGVSAGLDRTKTQSVKYLKEIAGSITVQGPGGIGETITGKTFGQKEGSTIEETVPLVLPFVTSVMTLGGCGTELKSDIKELEDVTKHKFFGHFGKNKSYHLESMTQTINGNPETTYKVSISDLNDKVASDFEAFKKEGLQTLINLGQKHSDGLEDIGKLSEVTLKAIDTGLGAMEEAKKSEAELLKAKDEGKAAVKAAQDAAKSFSKSLLNVSGAAKTILSNMPKQYFDTIKTLGDLINSGIGNLEVKKK